MKMWISSMTILRFVIPNLHDGYGRSFSPHFSNLIWYLKDNVNRTNSQIACDRKGESSVDNGITAYSQSRVNANFSKLSTTGLIHIWNCILEGAKHKVFSRPKGHLLHRNVIKIHGKSNFFYIHMPKKTDMLGI
jgi:hypothetical protein